MRYVALALILISLPMFINLLRQYPQHRRWALALLGLALFFGNTLRIDASIIGWPLWNGTAKGIEVSAADMLAIALISTRNSLAGRLPFWGLFVFYGATLFLSLVPSSVPIASFFVFWQFLRVVLLFAAIAGECHRDDLRKGLLTGLSLGLTLQAGFVVQQKASGVVQATGTMFHQNALGMMTELALLPLLAALLAGDRRRVVVVGIVAAMIIIAGGGSRGAMSIAGGGVMVLMLLSLARGVTPIKLKVVGLAMLALAVATPLAMMTLKERFGSSSITVQDDQRPAFERAAAAMAADHPFGVGANLYVPTANTEGYADKAGVAWNFYNRSAPVHNAYLLTRAEAGWLGELAFILMLLVPLLRGLYFAFVQRRGVSGEIALGCAVALSVNMIHNNFEFAGLLYNVLMLLGVNIALIAATLRADRRTRAPRSRQTADDPTKLKSVET
ncbi:MAG: O-antigen ligase family protein [Sphingomonas sp.]